MDFRRFASAAGLVIVLGISVMLSGCFGGVGLGGSPATNAEISKPKPVVESVSAATSGMLDKYYAILDINIKNEGADGTVIVSGSVSQGGQTYTNELPVYITRNTQQLIRLVLPLKWQGGEWTPSAEVRVP